MRRSLLTATRGPVTMPGTLVIFVLAFAVVLAAWFAAWHHTRNPANQNPREDFRQLQRHAAWLEQRLDQARRERWGSDLIASLSRQLGETCEQLGRARRGVVNRGSARLH